MSLAVIVREFGGPEKLRLEDVKVAAPGPNEIQVRHTAIGINYVDVYHRTGNYPLSLPKTIGMEAAGVVVAAGQGVGDFAPGDRIVYQSPMGSYAELRNMPADHAVKLPEAICDRDAAAAYLKGMTAYFLLHLTYPLKAGETVLIQAAAGGMGLILSQWAKAIGATVIGCAGSDEKCALARDHGCDHAINYAAADFRAAVQELTGGKGVDVVYDGVGQATFEASLDCLRPRGMMVSFGNATGKVAIPDLGILAAKGSLYVCRPNGAAYVRSRADRLEHAKAVFGVLASGKVKPVIGQTFALRDVAEAHRALEA
ncbi:MAG: quinone oxidoreductase, partial [Cucumibacter sp.]